MIILRCPYCLEQRTEDELMYGGEAGIVRASQPETVTDQAWVEYMYMRSNPHGDFWEQWCCSAGCGQWFKVLRHSVTHAIAAVVRFDVATRLQHAGR